MSEQDLHGPQPELPDEVVLDVSEGELGSGTRTIRVYDRARGDFLLEIPDGAKVTFGYFNPARDGLGFPLDLFREKGTRPWA